MNITREHTYRHLTLPEEASRILQGEIEECICEEEERLLEHAHGILRCRVVIDQPHRHHAKGNHYRVLVALSLPGREVCVSPHHRDGDLIAAVHDAFQTARTRMRRMLERSRRHHANGNREKENPGRSPEES